MDCIKCGATKNGGKNCRNCMKINYYSNREKRLAAAKNYQQSNKIQINEYKIDYRQIIKIKLWRVIKNITLTTKKNV